jgi:hypothetical protein
VAHCPHLLAPGRIGAMTVRTRDYFEARAKGGVGLMPIGRITPDAVVFTPSGESMREGAADSVVLAGTVEPDTMLFDRLVSAMPGAEVDAAGDCSGLGLIRKATEDGARAACAI